MAVAEAVLLIAASFKIPEFNLPLKPKTKGRKKGFLFKGKEAVESMTRNFGISKESATVIGNYLLNAGLIKCPAFTNFKDDSTVYFILDVDNCKIEQLYSHVQKSVEIILMSKEKISQKLVDEIKLKLTQPLDISDTDEIKFMISDESQQVPRVKAASVDKLIERLTNDTHPDVRLRNTFLLTYRSFITPHQLLKKLDERYHNRYADSATTKAIRLRVLAVIKCWVGEKYHSDFTEDNTLCEDVILFMKKMEAEFGSGVEQLRETFKKKITQKKEQRKLAIPSSPVIEFNWENFDEKNMARQICILESDLFSSISFKEFLNLNWQKHKEAAVHLIEMIDHFNSTSRWIQYEIVRKVKLSDRVIVVQKCINLCLRLLEFNNYNAVMELIAGLNNSCVRRLKKTWQEVGEAYKTKLNSIEQLMTHEGNYKDYRRTLRTCDPPAVPYLGIYLTDLTFIEEGNSDMDGNLINFDKRYKIAAILSEIQQFQKSGYSSFTEDTTIQYWLRHLPSVSEEEAYSISLKVEPRDLDEAVEKLLIDEDKLRQEVKILQLRNADLETTTQELKNTVEALTRELNKMRSMENKRLTKALNKPKYQNKPQTPAQTQSLLNKPVGDSKILSPNTPSPLSQPKKTVPVPPVLPGSLPTPHPPSPRNSTGSMSTPKPVSPRNSITNPKSTGISNVVGSPSYRGPTGQKPANSQPLPPPAQMAPLPPSHPPPPAPPSSAPLSYHPPFPSNTPPSHPPPPPPPPQYRLTNSESRRARKHQNLAQTASVPQKPQQPLPHQPASMGKITHVPHPFPPVPSPSQPVGLKSSSKQPPPAANLRAKFDNFKNVIQKGTAPAPNLNPMRPRS